VERQRLIEQLAGLPVDELVAVLRDVFVARMPFPETEGFWRSRFFLGIAHRDPLSVPEGAAEWETWWSDAVAYSDTTEPSISSGPDYRLCYAGTCLGCNTSVRSSAKSGLCPVCDTVVSMS